MSARIGLIGVFVLAVFLGGSPSQVLKTRYLGLRLQVIF